METSRLLNVISTQWETKIIPTLEDYIRIPNKSPYFDVDWQKNGHMAKAVELLRAWAQTHALPGMTLDVVQSEGRTPVILIDVPGQSEQTVLLYGHLDKQPEMEGWDEGLGPWTPVMKDGKLYGRGGADDGYSMFSAMTAIFALQEQKIPHARCVILIEASEESGSYDLPYYMEHLKAKIGTPDLVVCLDSGAGNYEQLWLTTTLRGVASGDLTVQILTEGVHSGGASGIVPSSFRIIRELLDRVENSKTGEVLLKEFHVEIPSYRQEEAQKAAEALGDELATNFPFVKGARAVSDQLDELLLNKTWRPTLSVVGAAGLPTLAMAGNVLRPYTTLKLSLRLPPTCHGHEALQSLKETLEKDPPYGAKVVFNEESPVNGWQAPETAPWLNEGVQDASQMFFGKPAMFIGEGGSIGFMGMLSEAFPGVQFMITGVLGPKSNAHGPNEFLHIDYAKKITACVSYILKAHYLHAQAQKA